MPATLAKKEDVNLNIALLDVAKVFNGFSLVSKAQLDVAGEQQKVKEILATAQQEMAELKKKGKSEVEINKKRVEIQGVIDKTYKDYEAKKRDYNQKINLAVATKLEKYAKANKYDLVIDKSYLVENANATDITDSFIKELEK
jgi:Skp family chaperone for outer membrane proteins